ncbi:hypothetical protein Q5752_004092 [Cryptotrichosporon argae]
MGWNPFAGHVTWGPPRPPSPTPLPSPAVAPFWPSYPSYSTYLPPPPHPFAPYDPHALLPPAPPPLGPATAHDLLGPLDAADVRAAAERMTGITGPWPDEWTHWVVRRWCASPETSKVLADVLNARLKLPPPCCTKALLIAQHLPAPALAALSDALAVPASSLSPALVALQADLRGSADAHKAAADEQAQADAWALWVGHFGPARAGLPPLPDEMTAKDPLEWDYLYGIGVPSGIGWVRIEEGM